VSGFNFVSRAQIVGSCARQTRLAEVSAAVGLAIANRREPQLLCVRKFAQAKIHFAERHGSGSLSRNERYAFIGRIESRGRIPLAQIDARDPGVGGCAVRTPRVSDGLISCERFVELPGAIELLR